MSTEPFTGSWLDEQLKREGKSAAGLARHLAAKGIASDATKVSKSRRGERKIQPNEVAPIWEYLGLPAADLPQALGLVETVPPPTRSETTRPPPDLILPRPGEEQLAPRFDGNHDVEVRGISVGGSRADADFSFNGEVVDYVMRPPGLLKRKDVFVTYVVNDSMIPALRPGDPLFLDPNRPPHAGDNVVVELFSEIEGGAGAAFIKELVRRSPSSILVRQFNPPIEIEFDRAEVKALYRVIPPREWLGL